jgi:DNA helicase HerA-like ATPase
VFFVTQNPTDVPNGVLSQLGLKVQHALRAFTAVDRKAIKLTAENYPLSEYYKTDETITALGIGEALITALNEKGIPTPLAATMLRAPMSRMEILSPTEINAINSSSILVQKYSQTIDRESAYEILSKKISLMEKEAEEKKEEERGRSRDGEISRSRTSSGSSYRRTSKAPQDQIVKVLTSATFIRGVFGILRKVMK